MYYLLDTDLNFVAPLENYKSVIWTNRYYTSGDFEFYIPATTEMMDLIKEDYYITRDDDYTQCMIIKNIQITTDIEEGNFIIVTGKSLKSILDRRIIWTQTTVNGTVEACVRKLIIENIINPLIPVRRIDNFILGAEIGITDTMRSQYTGKNLGETIREICINHGLGYDVLLDLDEKQFIFILFKGSDRSYKQNNNPYVVFSDEFENLLTTNYIYNGENFKNVALVAGEGEGVNRKKITVGDASGIQRYEMYVDSRDTSSTEEEGKTLTDEEYNEILRTKGIEALNENITTESIEGEVETNHQWIFNRDFFLGDIVEVVNEYGVHMQPQITEVIENEDDSGTNVVVTFATTIEKEV